MTSITIHGNLAKEFGNSFKLQVSSVKHAFDAIDANRPNFKNKIKKHK